MQTLEGVNHFRRVHEKFFKSTMTESPCFWAFSSSKMHSKNKSCSCDCLDMVVLDVSIIPVIELSSDTYFRIYCIFYAINHFVYLICLHICIFQICPCPPIRNIVDRWVLLWNTRLSHPLCTTPGFDTWSCSRFASKYRSKFILFVWVSHFQRFGGSFVFKMKLKPWNSLFSIVGFCFMLSQCKKLKSAFPEMWAQRKFLEV